MKRNNFLNTFISITIVAMFLITCRDKDEIAPTILLNGDNPMEVILNSKYIEPGATADDNADGNITSLISINASTIPVDAAGNTNKTGSYTVTYSVSDEAGNSTTEERTVNVVNSIEEYAVLYEVVKTCLTHNTGCDDANYETTLEADESVNNRIRFPDFFDLGFDVYGDIANDTIIIPAQGGQGEFEHPTDTPKTYEFLGVEGKSYIQGTTIYLEYNVDLTDVSPNIVTEVLTKKGVKK